MARAGLRSIFAPLLLLALAQRALAESCLAESPGGPASVQVLAEEARVFLWPDFLSPAECDHVISQAKPLLEPSGVIATAKNGSGVPVMHRVRTSSGAFLERQQDEIIAAIEQRIARWALLPVGNGEPLQVLRYEPGEKYSPHYDFFRDNSSVANGGNRAATIIVFLNDVPEGGETSFPLLPASPAQAAAGASECASKGLAVKPKRGTALLFWNLAPDGQLEQRSLHAGCPVLAGTKHVAVKWVRTGHYHTAPEIMARVAALRQQQQAQQAQRLSEAATPLARALAIAGGLHQRAR